VPFIVGNDRWQVDGLPFLLRAHDLVPRVPRTVAIGSSICVRLQNTLDIGDIELAPTHRDSAGIEVGDDLLVAHWPATVAEALHTKYILHDDALDRMNGELLLRLITVHFDDLGPVAERRYRAVPITRRRVLEHSVTRKFTSLSALILVEVGEHRSDEIAFASAPTSWVTAMIATPARFSFRR
jgi:hypothetical protein